MTPCSAQAPLAQRAATVLHLARGDKVTAGATVRVSRDDGETWIRPDIGSGLYLVAHAWALLVRPMPSSQTKAAGTLQRQRPCVGDFSEAQIFFVPARNSRWVGNEL